MYGHRESIKLVDIPGEEPGISAVLLTMAILGKTGKAGKVFCQNYLNSKLTSSAAQSTRELAQELLWRKLPVDGFEQPTPVLMYMEALDFMDLMPRDHARAVRRHINTVFRRYEQGAASMHTELIANAQNTDVRHEFARGGQAMEVEIIEDPEHHALKKRRLEAETVRLELENSKMQVENHKMQVENHKMLQDMQIDTIKTQYEFMKEIRGGKLQDRDIMFLEDSMRNVGGAKLITNGTSGIRRLITISTRCRELGYTRCTGEDYKAIGRIAARRFREKYGRKPSDPHPQEAAGGGMRSVNTYMAPDDQDVVDGAIEEHFTIATPCTAPVRRQWKSL